ncbi:septum site-determining protein MinC [Alteribacillus iranensis]|nr:septum site-determining protein MinC [Alteribacillus iranensis]
MAQLAEVKAMNTGPAKNLVTIKGTKEGLTVFLNDQCSYDALTEELKEKVARDHQAFGNGPEVEVKVDVGYRFLTKEQEHQIISLLEEADPIKVKEIQTEVISREEARKEREETGITSYSQIIRSGQDIRVKGDLYLLGDVNPGGTIQATGSIFVLGTLKGTARAGIDGDLRAVVGASVMDPHQLSIAGTYFHAPERHEKKEKGPLYKEPVFAYISEREKEIAFEKTRLLYQMKRDIEKD